MSRCPLYAEFKLEASLRTWQIRYCESDYASCVRYERAQRGLVSSPRLLPNGKELPARSSTSVQPKAPPDDGSEG
jgi:hypothetical protein